MAKKTAEDVIEEMIEEVVEGTPLPITTNFGREDLNELRDTVNFLLSRLK